MSVRALFRATNTLGFAGYVHGPNWAPRPLTGAPGRHRSLKHSVTHGWVPVQGGPGGLTKHLPSYIQAHVVENTDYSEHKYESARGRLRYELNWPWRAHANKEAFDWAMTIDEAEEYYATPKEGVDFMYNAPPGHEENPLVIRSQTPNMFVAATVFCKGMCTPNVPETPRFWRMFPGQRYKCNACDAHIELDGFEDVIVAPDTAPLEDEDMPPFEHIEPEFDYWMKRGFPLLGHINYSTKAVNASVTGT